MGGTPKSHFSTFLSYETQIIYAKKWQFYGRKLLKVFMWCILDNIFDFHIKVDLTQKNSSKMHFSRFLTKETRFIFEKNDSFP